MVNFSVNRTHVSKESFGESQLVRYIKTTTTTSCNCGADVNNYYAFKYFTIPKWYCTWIERCVSDNSLRWTHLHVHNLHSLSTVNTKFSYSFKKFVCSLILKCYEQYEFTFWNNHKNVFPIVCISFRKCLT